MTFTHEPYEGSRKDKETREGIGQLLPGNRDIHRKEETRRSSCCQMSDVTTSGHSTRDDVSSSGVFLISDTHPHTEHHFTLNVLSSSQLYS